ncbi:hypothetical protein [Actinokineospora terrae]|uniref:hypothetical protein n=1 Tax=Actinokineospora terrae TaxID=155974 RepID=UPI001FEA83AB|nr:hypothetical protein [Actinokineospora terrae]
MEISDRPRRSIIRHVQAVKRTTQTRNGSMHNINLGDQCAFTGTAVHGQLNS